MSDSLLPPPAEIALLAERCALHVEGRFGLRPDGTPETLSLLDHLIAAVVVEEARGAVPPPGHPLRSHLVHILAPPLCAWFGEVVRGQFACRWRLEGGGPLGWTIDFDRCLLRLSPFAAAAEAIMRDHRLDGTPVLRTAPQSAAGLRDRLAAAPGLPNDEFFALANRFEVLQISTEWLAIGGNGAESLSDADYDRVFCPGTTPRRGYPI
ncbi:MAG TPA: hypothetical protein VM285_13675 [Polyangia bacterium]|nr:hypothetical protein [Polyangia bacterium]